MLTLAVKPQWVSYKQDEVIEQPCSDFSSTHVLVGTTSIRFSKDNHDSWGTCTTSVECKTVITVMLMVMSGMDPHMISGNLGWVFVKSWLGCVEVGFIRLWVGHGETP
jgi:hypothetical protein